MPSLGAIYWPQLWPANLLQGVCLLYWCWSLHCTALVLMAPWIQLFFLLLSDCWDFSLWLSWWAVSWKSHKSSCSVSFLALSQKENEGKKQMDFLWFSSLLYLYSAPVFEVSPKPYLRCDTTFTFSLLHIVFIHGHCHTKHSSGYRGVVELEGEVSTRQS